MSEIDKVTRLLELATLYRLREEFDLTTPGEAEATKPFDRNPSQKPVSVAEKEDSEPVSG